MTGVAASEPVDEAVIAAFIAGDHEAFAVIVRAYTERLLRYLIVMRFPASDADDVVQETFFRAFDRRQRFDDRYRLSTWLLTITRRLALNHRRGRRGWAALEQVAEPAGAAPEPDAAMTNAGLWCAAQRLLPPRQYEALWLRYGEELELAEVADLLAISRGNARVLVHRARERLAATLDPEAWR